MRTLGIALVLSLVFLWSSVAAAAAETADLIIVGGTIYTLDPNTPRVEAVAVAGQWIVCAGTLGEVTRFRGSSTRTLDVTGMTVLPGFVDAHAHLKGLGSSLSQVDLVGTKSPKEARQRVLERMASARPGEWVEGRGWDQNDWEVEEFPAWSDLEGTDSHPLFLRRIDGHAAWVNRRALEVCGITRDTPDPAGGRIVRDDAGEPTGILVDNAAEQVRAMIPELSFDERVKRLKRAVAECQRYGLTGVHDAGVGARDLEAIRYLDEHGELGLRVYAMLDADEPEFAEAQIRRGPVTDEDHYVVVRALKLYADGALGSRGAALIDPYCDEPDNRGLFVHTQGELLRWTSLALENGFQGGPCGPRANRGRIRLAKAHRRGVPDRVRIRFPGGVGGSSLGDLRRGDAEGSQGFSRRRMVPRGVHDDRGSCSGLHHECGVRKFHVKHKWDDTTIYASRRCGHGHESLRYSRTRDFVLTRRVYDGRREDCLHGTGEIFRGGVT